MSAPFEQYTRKEKAAPVSSGAPFEQYTKIQQPEVTPTSTYENQFPGDIDVPPQNGTPADWFSPQQKAARRQEYLLNQKNKAPEDTWTDKVRAGIETAGGMLTSIVASVPGIPYGVYNAIKNSAEGKKADTENEIFKGINSFTPEVLMPHSNLGQKYMGNVGTALQGMPVLGGEGAVFGQGAQMAAQFAKAKAASALAGKTPLTITPLAIASKAHGTSPELHAEIVKHENAGTVNPVVAQRHIDADTLPEVTDDNGNVLKIRLTKGMATQDSKILSDEKNVRAADDPVRKVIDDNGKAMPLILDKFQKQVAPDINFRNAPEEGQFYIDKLNQIRDTLRTRTREAYQDLHDASENSGLTNTPLDANAFAKDVESRFKSLGMYHEDLPSWTKRRVEEIASGEYPLTFKNFEQFRSDLGMEQRDLSRSNASGSSRSLNAVNEIRDALENMPLTKEAQQLKPLADKARASAKLDFDLQKRIPAYKSVVDGTAVPDDFVEKYILGNRPKTASQQQVSNLVSMFPDDNEFHQALAYSTLNDIKNQAVNSKGQLSSAKLDKAIKTNENNGKHELLLPIPIRDGLEKLNKTAQLVQGAPAGAYIQSNPNLSATLGHYINSGTYKMVSSIPLIGEPLAGLKKGFQAKKFSSESTKIGAGLDYPVRK